MKQEDVYNIVSEELSDTLARLQDTQIYCTDDLNNARRMNDKVRIATLSKELHEVNRRLKNVNKVIKYISSKL